MHPYVTLLILKAGKGVSLIKSQVPSKRNALQATSLNFVVLMLGTKLSSLAYLFALTLESLHRLTLLLLPICLLKDTKTALVLIAIVSTMSNVYLKPGHQTARMKYGKESKIHSQEFRVRNKFVH